MDEFLKIACPCCETVLIIERRTGKILEQRKPILEKEQATGDRFEDALKKARGSKDAAEQKFLEAQKKEKERKAKIESLFNEELKRVKESGEEITKPRRDIDLD